MLLQCPFSSLFLTVEATQAAIKVAQCNRSHGRCLGTYNLCRNKIAREGAEILRIVTEALLQQRLLYRLLIFK